MRRAMLVGLGIAAMGCASKQSTRTLIQPSSPLRFEDATLAAGLPAIAAARGSFCDLDDDDLPDIYVRDGDRYRVFMNHVGTFVELEHHNLPVPRGGDVLTLSDIDNDGVPDAIFARYLDAMNPKYVASTTQPTGTGWAHGNGDGAFADLTPIPQATAATTAAIAVGDLNQDGLPDIVLGNWYDRYGEALTAYTNDVLLRQPDLTFARWTTAEESVPFDEQIDAGPRPTYGVAIGRFPQQVETFLPVGVRPNGKTDIAMSAQAIIEVNYGRRWNRFRLGWMPEIELASELGLDGDAIRNGRYPAATTQRALTDPRFPNEPEKPFRSNGNTFDISVGDLNGDGDFDLLFTEITHAWAGESSDRTRVLLWDEATRKFVSPPEWSLDREGTHDDPTSTQPATWNQGDIFSQIVDLDGDGQPEILIASSDYPDPPPHENRLRVWKWNGSRLVDVTADSGLDQIGAGQISVADYDGDGRLDVLVGQSYNRLTPSFLAANGLAPTPQLRLFRNVTISAEMRSLKLVGDPQRGMANVPYNAIVRFTQGKTTRVYQLLGPGGHGGKLNSRLIFLPAGPGVVEVDWGANHKPSRVRVESGREPIVVRQRD